MNSSASLKSGIFTFPVTDGKCECAFDAVEIFGCKGDMWDERKSYNTPLETATGRTFTSLAKFENIVSQLVFTPDGKLCFFEFNLPTAITGYDYLFLAFPESAKAKIPLDPTKNQNITHYTEFALFDTAIPAPTTPTTPTTPDTPDTPDTPATGDATMLAVIGLSLAAVVGTTLVIKKKED